MEKKELIIRIVCGLLAIIIFQPIIATCNSSVSNGDWQILFWFGFILILTAQYSTLPEQFYTGSGIVIIAFIKSKLGIGGNDDQPDSDTANKPTNASNNKNEGGNTTVVTDLEAASGALAPAAGKDVGFWTLMPSAFITWIFAKSIQNASVLAAKYGILGSIAYAGWYVSFFSASGVIYILRTRHNSSSLPGTVEHIYGPIAQILFCLGLLYRLNNEVWSNALVVAGFYGDDKSFTWWLAAIFSSIIPGVYVYLGGMRSSLISDVLQAFLAILFLFVILILIFDEPDFELDYEPSGGWPDGGWELLIVALIQGTLSYPFHDPVLTDRCYLSNPTTMLYSFTVGGFISMVFITLFGIIGIYGAQAVGSGQPAAIGKALGTVTYSLMNIVFMTSSMSTLDSTFTSTAKIIGLDIGGWVGAIRNDGDQDNIGPLRLNDIGRGVVNDKHVILGRIGIIVMVIVGILPLLEETTALNATLVSGTTVMGLGVPIYLLMFWKYGEDGWRQSPCCFIFSFITGVVYGALYQANSQGVMPDGFDEDLRWGLDFGKGSYTTLLGCNVWGHLCCAVAAGIGFALDQYVLQWGPVIEMETSKDAGKGSGGGVSKVEATTMGNTSSGSDIGIPNTGVSVKRVPSSASDAGGEYTLQ